MKAISTVIASILMLMIVVALGGTTYLYISGIFTSKTATTFEIIDSINDTITIRNSGTETITEITATLDGNAVNIAVVPNILGIVAYWSLNEGIGGTTADNSGNNNLGTLQPSCPDCPIWQDGKYGKSLQFDGSNDYVSVASSPSLDFPADGSFTVMAWFNLKDTSAGGLRVIAGNYFIGNTYTETGYLIYARYYDASDIQFIGRIGNSGASPSSYTIETQISTNTWYHGAMTYDGTTQKLYLNGALINSQDAIMGNPDDNFAVGVADKTSLNFWFFNGIIDEVHLYNRALSESEIKQLNAGLVSPGQTATIKLLTSLSKGTHTLRLCTSSMCNTAILTIQ